MRNKESEVNKKCPHYSVKNEISKSCRVSISRLEPDIVRETYFCRTDEYKNCLIHIGHKPDVYKKTG